MKNFAGVNLDSINTCDFRVLHNVCQTFSEDFSKKLDSLAIEDPIKHNQLRFMPRDQINPFIKHLENYNKMKTKEHLLGNCDPASEFRYLILDVLLKLGCENAPDDFNCNGRIHWDAKFLDQYLECCELDPDFEALSLEQEQIMHQHYKDAMEKNLSIAHEKLNDLQDMTNRVSDNSLLPYALSMQVVEFIKIIYYLHRRETESNDEIYNTFLIKSLYALDRTVSKLKALPEEEDRASAGYFSGLMFSNWFSVEDKTPIIKAKDFKLTV